MLTDGHSVGGAVDTELSTSKIQPWINKIISFDYRSAQYLQTRETCNEHKQVKRNTQKERDLNKFKIGKNVCYLYKH